MSAPQGCKAAKNGHNSPSAAAKCPGCRRAKVPNIISASVAMTPERWKVARVTSLTNRERQRAAMDTNTDPEALTALARDRDVWIRLYVGANTSTPVETLRHMGASSNDIHVVSAVLGNKSLPDADFGPISRRIAKPRKTPSQDDVYSHSVIDNARKRVSARFGIHKDNIEALDAIADEQWWEMDESSDEVFIVKTMFSDREQ